MQAHASSGDTGAERRSLLVYSRMDNAFRHYDSARGANHRAARALASKAAALLGCA